MSAQFQEIPIYQRSVIGNNIIQQIGVAVFLQGDLTPANLVLAASFFDYRDTNFSGDVRGFEFLNSSEWFSDSILRASLVKEMFIRNSFPELWNDVENKIFFETTANALTEVTENFLSARVVGPIAGSIQNKILAALGAGATLQFIYGEFGPANIKQYIEQSLEQQLGFGNRLNGTGISVSYVDQGNFNAESTSERQFVSVSSSGSSVTTGSGSDILYGGGGTDPINAGGGADSVYAGGGADSVDGGTGNDDLRGEGGADTIRGGLNDDLIYGGTEGDNLLGDGGADSIKGEDGNDIIRGGTENDTIYGDGENDSLFGDEGDDSLIGGPGNDVIDGGAHILGDTVRFDYTRNDYTIAAITGGFRVSANRGGEGIDTVRGVEWFEFANGVRLSQADLIQPSNPQPGGQQTYTPTPVLAPPTPPPPSPVTGTPYLYAAPFSVAEGDSGIQTASVRVYLSQPTTNAVSFTYSLLGRDSVGWARSGTDFNYSIGTGVILAGQTFVDLPVQVRGDTRIEGTEKLEFLLTSPIGATFEDGARIYTIAGTIRDNDAPSVPPPPPPPPPRPVGPIYIAIEADDVSLVEGPDGTFTEFDFVARRSGDLSVETRIRYEVTGFGATPATADDFDTNSFPTANHTFDVGETTDRFTVRVRGDATTEANEAFQVRLLARSSGVTVTDGEAAVTIRNDDGETLPTPAGPVYVSVRAIDTVRAEGTGASGATTPFTFEVRREGDLNQETQVGIRLVTTGSTPQAAALVGSGGDFSVSGYTVTFGIGESVVTRTFSALADTRNEPDEPFTVRLTTRSGYENVVFTDRTANGIILNDDGPAPPLVTAPAVAVVETDADRVVNLRVQLSHATTAPVTMNYEVYAFASSQAPSTAGADFVAATGTLTVTPGSTFADIPVTLRGDDLAEGLEVIDVRLSNLVNGYFGRSISDWDSAILVLDDDGSRRWPGVQALTPADYVDLGKIDAYSAQRVDYWLDANQPSQLLAFELDQPLIVQSLPFLPPQLLFSASGEVIEARVSRVDGIEVGDVRNALAEGAVLQPGQYFLLFEKPVDQIEGSFTFELSGIPLPGELPLLTFDVDEGAVEASGFFTAFLSLAQTSDVSFDVALRPLSASSGSDFDASTQRVTIAAGDKLETIVLLVSNDLVFEGNETFEIVVRNVTGAILPNQAPEWTILYTIRDDDPSPTPVFTVAGLTSERAEGTGSPGVFTFQIARPFGGEGAEASVAWAIRGSGANQATAADFVGGVLPAGVATFAAGEVTKNITVQVVADAIPELDEGFSIVLSNPSAGFGLVNAVSNGVIRNDDGVFRPGYLGARDAEAAVSYTMGADEIGFLASGASATDVTGNTLANRIAGNNAANRILGAGADDILSGEGGNDTIDGGQGADRMHGGSGNDMFIVDNALDEVAEDAGAGIDRIIASVDYELPTSVERLDLVGAGLLSGAGNDAANSIFGNISANRISGRGANDLLYGLGGNDTLEGGTGADRLDGGAGRDAASYADATASVLVDLGGVLAPGGAAAGDVFVGIEDLIGSGFADTLFGSGIANLIAGGAGHDSIAGGDGNDTIQGDAGSDTMDGGTGGDRLAGGVGDDLYRIDSAFDLVVEQTDSGSDLVLTGLPTYVLGANVENVTATNAIAHRFTGNALANVMAGNAESDTLIGGAGNDTLQGGGAIDWLYGGTNDDTYFVEAATDRVLEGLNQGIDIVRTAAPTYTLPVNVETLIGTFAGGQALTGNTLANAITGFTGADTLNGGIGDDTLEGGAGIDRLLGGTGNDSFRIEAATDVIVEFAGQGTDTVIMLGNAGYTLGANLENLVLAGTVAANGVGNTLGNAITGNALGNVLSGFGGNDILDGAGGVDILIGGIGQDTLTGGAGNDQFRFLTPAETTLLVPDLIADFTPGQDRIDLRFIDGASATPLAFVTGAPVAAGQVGVVAIGAGTWQVQGDLDGGGADFAITVVSATGPSAGWFLL